jgi:predicted deacetylase
MRKSVAIASAVLLALDTAFSLIAFINFAGHSKPSIVAIRVDDIQDYYLRDVQIQLLQHSVSRGYPLTLGIIAMDFGLDSKLVETVKAAVRSGCEAAAHGWKHEDLAQLTVSEQKVGFLRAKNRLLNTLAVNTSVLIPPTYSYSNDTLLAMSQTGYGIVSGYIDLNKAGLTSENIVSVPATDELSDENGDTWTMKSVDNLMAELSTSIATYGYSVIVTHPAEFVLNGTFDENGFARYCEVLDIISSKFALTTLGKLKPRLLLQDSSARVSEWLNSRFGLVSFLAALSLRLSHTSEYRRDSEPERTKITRSPTQSQKAIMDPMPQFIMLQRHIMRET